MVTRLSFSQRKKLNGIKETVRCKILVDKVDFNELISRESGEISPNIISTTVLFSCLQEIGMEMNEKDRELIIKKFMHYQGGLKFKDFCRFLQLDRPSDYVDPSLTEDRLPQPYRMIVKLMEECIIEPAWYSIESKRKPLEHINVLEEDHLSPRYANKSVAKLNQVKHEIQSRKISKTLNVKLCAPSRSSQVNMSAWCSCEDYSFTGNAQGVLSRPATSDINFKVFENAITGLRCTVTDGVAFLLVSSFVDASDDSAESTTNLQIVKYTPSSSFELVGISWVVPGNPTLWIDSRKYLENLLQIICVNGTEVEVSKWTMANQQDDEHALEVLKSFTCPSDQIQFEFPSSGVFMYCDNTLWEYDSEYETVKAMRFPFRIVCSSLFQCSNVELLGLGLNDGTCVVWNINLGIVRATLRYQLCSVVMIRFSATDQNNIEQDIYVHCACSDGIVRLYQLVCDTPASAALRKSEDEESILHGGTLISEVDDRELAMAEIDTYSVQSMYRVAGTPIWVVSWVESQGICKTKIYDFALAALIGELDSSFKVLLLQDRCILSASEKTLEEFYFSSYAIDCYAPIYRVLKNRYGPEFQNSHIADSLLEDVLTLLNVATDRCESSADLNHHFNESGSLLVENSTRVNASFSGIGMIAFKLKGLKGQADKNLLNPTRLNESVSQRLPRETILEFEKNRLSTKKDRATNFSSMLDNWRSKTTSI